MTGVKLKFGSKIKNLNCCGSPPPPKKLFSLQVCVRFRPFFNGENENPQKYVCVWVSTHTDCTLLHPYFYRFFDAPHKHTHGLHTNTHILALIVVSVLKTGTKRHTYLTRKSIFFWRGAPATENIFAFFGHPGRPRHRKIRYFWRPGALSQKHTHTHTRWPRGRSSPFLRGEMVGGSFQA